MEDDLDSFFAKKKAKGKKKVGVQAVDDIAKRLEETVKATADESGEPETTPVVSSVVLDDPVLNKDKENDGKPKDDEGWIEFEEDEAEDTLIKEYVPDQAVVNDESEDEDSEKKKTIWNVGQPQPAESGDEDEPGKADEDAPAEKAATPTPGPEAAVTAPSRYVPPALRSGSGAGIQKRFVATKAAPNVDDSDQFPTLAVAATIDTEVPKKKPPMPSAWGAPRRVDADGFTTVTSEREHHHDRYRPPIGGSGGSSQASYNMGSPAPPPAPKNPNAYVPPHLRQAGGDQQMKLSNAFTALSSEQALR